MISDPIPSMQLSEQYHGWWPSNRFLGTFHFTFFLSCLWHSTEASCFFVFCFLFGIFNLYDWSLFLFSYSHKKPKFSATLPSYFSFLLHKLKGISNPIHIDVYKHFYSNDYIILPKSGLNTRIPVATPTHLNLLSIPENLFSHVFYSISIKSGIYLFAQRCFPFNLSI